jgi:hypothetical protein
MGYFSWAQITPRHLLEKAYTFEKVKEVLIPFKAYHPYPKTTDDWKKVVPNETLENIIKEGETALKGDFEAISGSTSLDFVRSGDRLAHSKISFGKRNQLTTLILAESIEGKGRFMEAIFNGIWSICEESYWGVPAHISGTGLPDVENPVVDLFAAETAAVLAMADYMVGDKLDDINKLIRKRIYFETNKRIFIPMNTKSDRYGWMSKTKQVNNWNPWIMSNWLMTSLLLEKDDLRRAEMVYAAMKGLDLYINGLGEDGGCDEGPSYWFAAGGSVFDCLELLEKSTSGQINIFKEPIIQKMAAYVYKAHIDGFYFTNFADADPVLKPDGLMLYRFGLALKDENMKQFGQWANLNFNRFEVNGNQRMRTIENMMTIKDIPSQTIYQPVQDAWISDIKVMTTRSAGGLYLAAHGGHNAESHNHNDVGDFIVYADGKPMIVDAGRGNYTARTFSSKRYELWFTQSNYHNLPIINGFGQKEGRDFEAKNVSYQISAKESVLKMDLADAYPKEAAIKKWQRSISLQKEKEKIILADDYELSAISDSLQHIFMTVCAVDISTPGKILLTSNSEGQSKEVKPTRLLVTYNPALWIASTEFPSTEGMEYSSFKTKWNGSKVQRIILTSKKLDLKGKLQFDITKG